MIILTSLTAVLFMLTLILLKLTRHETILSENSARGANVVHIVKEHKGRVEVFVLRESPTLLYHSLRNLYKKSKP